jgi:diguanylate cyclase (GGDEF)-like protein
MPSVIGHRRLTRLPCAPRRPRWRSACARLCTVLALGLLVAGVATAAPATPATSTPAAARAPAPLPAGEFERLLEQADAIRSTEPRQFLHLLATLDAHRAEADRAQREHLTYLHAYDAIYQGRYAEGIAAAQRLLDAAQEPDQQVRAGALIVNAAAISRNYPLGLRTLGPLLARVDAVHDPEVREHVLYAAASLYRQLGQYALAQTQIERMLERPTSPRTRCFANQLRYELLQVQGQLNGQDAPLTEAIGQCAAIGDRIGTLLLTGTLARKWSEAGRASAALALLQRRADDVHAINYPPVTTNYESQLAALLLAQGDRAGAERHARLATEAGAGLGNVLPMVTAWHTLYQVAEHRGDSAAALDAYRHYSDTQRAYLDEARTRELVYQVVSQETAEKTQQIALLDRENKVLALRQELARRETQNTRLVLALVGALLLLLGSWAWRMHRHQRALRERAETDALTGVHNRPHFEACARRLLGACRASNEPAALITFDLDEFKSINDRFGHGVGDWVLQRVAETCRGMCRRIDVFGRTGGEEFGLVLHGCDLTAGVRMAEDCRLRISQIDSRPAGHHFPITASFGVSATSLRGYDYEVLFDFADRALYRAKNGGRNCVVRDVIDTPPESGGHGQPTAAPPLPA